MVRAIVWVTAVFAVACSSPPSRHPRVVDESESTFEPGPGPAMQCFTVADGSVCADSGEACAKAREHVRHSSDAAALSGQCHIAHEVYCLDNPGMPPNCFSALEHCQRRYNGQACYTTTDYDRATRTGAGESWLAESTAEREKAMAAVAAKRARWFGCVDLKTISQTGPESHTNMCVDVKDCEFLRKELQGETYIVGECQETPTVFCSWTEAKYGSGTRETCSQTFDECDHYRKIVEKNGGKTHIACARKSRE